jgi:nitrite reductase/ring-hydroxylating ferredoxin subunit
MRIVDAGGLRIGVVRIGGEAFAVHDRCPHQGAPLCTGPLGSRISYEDGAVVNQADVVVLACPWHHWEFDVRSGRSLFDERYRVRTFPTEIVDGSVRVRVRPN